MSDQAKAKTTEVEIFGASYAIRGGQKPAELTKLAAEVDRRMRELAGHVNNVDPGRLAILTALNLADELSRNRREMDGERGEIDERVKSLADQLAGLQKSPKSGRKGGRKQAKNASRGTP